MRGLNDMAAFIKKESAGAGAVSLRKDQIVFEERVRLSCFYCGRHGKNWRCPPNIPDLDFKTVISEYERILLVYRKFPYNDVSYEDVRRDSTVSLHKTLLSAEKYLWKSNVPLYASFIGGSCKLCKNGCDASGCANPASARIPVEALGINVIKTALNAGVEITFPPDKSIMRAGLLCW